MCFIIIVEMKWKKFHNFFIFLAFSFLYLQHQQLMNGVSKMGFWIHPITFV